MFDGERFNLRRLNGLEVRKQHQIEIINRFAALENLSDGEETNRDWENVRDHIDFSAEDSLGRHESIQHKPHFDGECLDFLDERKQVIAP
jgi:hypothetical protein